MKKLISIYFASLFIFSMSYAEEKEVKCSKKIVKDTRRLIEAIGEMTDEIDKPNAKDSDVLYKKASKAYLLCKNFDDRYVETNCVYRSKDGEVFIPAENDIVPFCASVEDWVNEKAKEKLRAWVGH